MAMLIAGPREDLCLDYANTLSWRGRARPVEALAGFDQLHDWLVRQTCWPPAVLAAAAPQDAVFAEALAWREAIFCIFGALSAGRPIADADLARLADAVAAAPQRRLLARRNGGFGWQVEAAAPTASLLLAPVLWSAADLLIAAPRHGRVRRCANDECLWLFLDNSKSGNRRWCDMAACGNRAKARRHYLKITAAADRRSS